MERRFDDHGRLIVDWDEVSAGARRSGPPTPDDVSITRDGRRIDTADKVREMIAELQQRQRAHATSHGR